MDDSGENHPLECCDAGVGTAAEIGGSAPIGPDFWVSGESGRDFFLGTQQYPLKSISLASAVEGPLETPVLPDRDAERCVEVSLIRAPTIVQ